MSSPPLTAVSRSGSAQRERAVRIADHDHLRDLNLTALEEQYFVEWEVPPEESPEGGPTRQ